MPAASRHATTTLQRCPSHAALPPPPCTCALREIIKLPPGALQGLKEGVADEMLKGGAPCCLPRSGL